MPGGGKDLSAQLSRQSALDQSGDDKGAAEETTTSAGHNSQSPMKLEESGNDAPSDTTGQGQYLSVFFSGGDGTEFKIDLTKAIDAGAVGRVTCEPARDVLERNISAQREPDTTTCVGASSKLKRRHPKLIDSGPAEHIGSGWTYKTYQRMNGTTEGQTDTYWFSPVLQKRFRSRKEIDRFLKLYDDARTTLLISGVNSADADSRNGGVLESTAWEQFRTESSSFTNDKNVDKDRKDIIPPPPDNDFTFAANAHALKRTYHPKETGADEDNILWARYKYQKLEGRIRKKLKEANYEGNVDHMVPIVLAKLRTVVDPNDPAAKHARLSDCLLEDVISRCTGCSFHSGEQLQSGPQHVINERTVTIEMAELPKPKRKRYSRYLKKNFTFDDRIEQLRQFKAKFGHCNPTRTKKYSEDDFPGLSGWCSNQRKYMRQKVAGSEFGKRRMPEKHERMLLDIGFEFTLNKRKHEYCSWEERLEQLKLFKEVHGHCMPKEKDCVDEFEGLYQWYMHQRLLVRKKMTGDEDGKKKMPDEKEKKLREIGFVCNNEELVVVVNPL